MSIKKHIFSVILAFAFICMGTNVKSAETTDDAANFAKRVDDTLALKNIVSRYSTAAKSVQDNIDTLNKTIKDLGVQKDLGIKGKNAFVESDEAKKYVKEINLALETAEGLNKKAADILNKYNSIDASAINYNEKVADLNKEWGDALADVKTKLNDKESPDFENLNTFGVAALGNYLEDTKNTFSALSSDVQDSGKKISEEKLNAVNSALLGMLDSISDSTSELEEGNESFDKALSSDASSSDDDENKKDDDAKDKDDSSVSKDDASSSGSSSSSASSGSSNKRTPFCSRTAGIAGKGDMGSSGGAGGGASSDSSTATGPTNPAACGDVADIYKILELKEKGLSFGVFLNAMKGFNQKKANGKLAILDFTQPGNKKRFYLMDLNDLKNPKMLAWEKSSHGNGYNTVSKTAIGEKTLMSNIHESGRSSIGFAISAENYRNTKNGWPAKIDSNGNNGKRIRGMERGYNDNMYDRGCVMHSSSDAGWANGYAPTSLCCIMFEPSISANVINNLTGTGTLIFINNVIPGDYFQNSAIINGSHGISNECK